MKVSELTEEVVEQQAIVLETGGKEKWATRLRRAFARRVKDKLKGEDKKEVKKEITRYSYVIALEYLDANIDWQRYPLELLIWSNSTFESVMGSLKGRSNITVGKKAGGLAH